MSAAPSGAPAPRPASILEAAGGATDSFSRAAGWSFVLFAAALPVAIAPMNVTGALCLALTLAVWVTRKGPGPARTPLDLPAVAWLAAMGLSTLLALDRAASAASLGKGLI
ncbi:MAG: hypothetical protein ACRENJ_05425, partial [Candidatus Eiseniibacteriota bacterium]